jgi:hypothetical protein
MMHIIPRVIVCSEGLHDVFIIMKDSDVRTNPIMGSGGDGDMNPLSMPWE